MAEYIEREAAYPLAKKVCDAIDSKDFQRLNFGMRILDWIDDIPAADVRPVVRGKWDNIIQGIIPSGQCSNCGAWDKVTRFCPNCGADMRET